MTDPVDPTDPAVIAVEASGDDPRAGLRAAVALRRLAETLEALQVDNARRRGWSWQDIAEALEVTKQAVHKKHAARSPHTRPSPHTQPSPHTPRPLHTPRPPHTLSSPHTQSSLHTQPSPYSPRSPRTQEG